MSSAERLPKTQSKRRLRLSGLVLALAALFALGRVLPVGTWLVALVSSLQAMGAIGAILLSLAYIPAALIFVPAALLSFAAGFTFGPIVGALIAVPGIALSSWCAFLLSRTVLRSPIETWLKDDPRFQVVDALIARFGPKAVVLLRFSPLSPFNILNFIFGLSGIKPTHYFVATLVGALPGSIFYSQLGALAPQLDELANGRLPRGGAAQTSFHVSGICLTLGVAIWLSRLAKQAMATKPSLPQSPSETKT